MRKLMLALAGAAAVIIPAVHAQAAPMSSIFNCQKPNNNSGAGAVIGGLIGGVIGNGIAGDDRRDRVAGTVIGVGVGAAVGSSIGCNMSAADTDRAQSATTEALNENRSTTWENNRSGVSGRVDIVNTFYRGDVDARAPDPGYGPPRSLNDVRFARDVAFPREYDMIAARYRATDRVNLFAAPDNNSAVLGSLRDGEDFDALARVNSDWLLVGQGGMAVGYVMERRADLEGKADLYAYNDRPDARPVADRQVCRTFDQTVIHDHGRETTQRFTACQVGGEWVVDG